jgi:hypothetical protein
LLPMIAYLKKENIRSNNLVEEFDRTICTWMANNELIRVRSKPIYLCLHLKIYPYIVIMIDVETQLIDSIQLTQNS